MRVLLLCTGFAPEPSGAAPLNTELAVGLASRGHEVTVATTFPHFPEWHKSASYRGRHLVTEHVDGVVVLRSEGYFPSPPTPLKRITYDTIVSTSIVANAARSPRPDVIMAVCTPLQLGLGAALLARRWNVPFVFHVQDLVPESAVELGMLQRKSAIAVADRMAAVAYRRAALITVIGPTFAAAIERRGVDPAKIEYLPNWVDSTSLVPGTRATAFRAQAGLTGDDFLVGYVGNMGFKQHMVTVVEAAGLLTDDPRIRFSLIGDGSDLASVKARIGDLGLGNVDLGAAVPRDRLPEILASADLLVVHQAAAVKDMVVPSKLLTYAAAGRPVLFAGHPRSAGALFVEESGGGVVIAPEDPRAMARAIEELRRDPERRRAMGAAGRAHVEGHHDIDAVLRRAEDLLRGLVDTGGGTATDQRASTCERATSAANSGTESVNSANVPDASTRPSRK